MIDVNTPNSPVFAGCHMDFYVHDTQCVSYDGPDTDYAGSEICVNSAEDRLEIVDVTNKSSSVSISDVVYAQLGYVHQGWLTEDHRFFLVGDEFDELNFSVPTRTHVFDVTDLDAPAYVFAYEAATTSIDPTCTCSVIEFSRQTTRPGCVSWSSVTWRTVNSWRSLFLTRFRTVMLPFLMGHGVSIRISPRARSLSATFRTDYSYLRCSSQVIPYRNK
jgi:hypothetical protein